MSSLTGADQGSKDGFRDVDYNNVAHVASTLGTKLSDEQVSNLSEQSEVNKNYDVVNGKLLSKHNFQIGTEDGAEHQKAYHAAKDTPNDVKLSQLEATGKEQNEAAIKEGQSNGTTPLTGVNDAVANTAVPGSKPSNEPLQVPSSMNKFAETAAQSIALMEASDGSGMTDDQKAKVFDAIEKNTMTVKEGSQLFNSVGSGEVTANQAISEVEDKEQLLASNQNNGVVGESAGGNNEPAPVAPSTTVQTQQNSQGNELTGMAKLASMVVSALPSTLSPTNNENDQSLSQNNGNQGTPESNTEPKQDRAGSEDTLKNQGPTAQPSTFTPAPQVSSATPQQAADTVATNPESSQPQPQPETQVASASPQKTTDSVALNPRPVGSEQQQAPQSSTVTPATQVASATPQQAADTVATNPESSQPQPATQVASVSPQKTTDSVALNPSPANSEQDGPANLGQFANIPNTQADDVPNNEYKVGNQTQLAALNDPNSPTVTGSGAMDQALLESSQFSGMADGDKEIVMEAIASGQLTADEGVEIFNAVQSGDINSEDAILIANGTKELSNVMSEQLASNNTGTQINESTQHIDQSGANSSVIEGRDQATTGQFETQLASESTSQFDNSTAPYNGSDTDTEVRESGSQLASTSFEAPNDGTTDSNPPAPNADLDNNGGKLDIARALTTGDKTNLEMDADEIINGDKLDTVVGLGGSVGEIDGDVNYDQDTKLT